MKGRTDGTPGKLAIGQMRHRLTIEEKLKTGLDTLGADIYTWSAWKTLYGHVVVTGGLEREGAQGEKTTYEERYTIELQYITGIERNMRVLWEGRYLDIMDVADPFGMRDRTILKCREWVE